MPVTFNIDSKRGESFKFNPADIKIGNFTGRKFGASDSAIKKMAESFLRQGQLQEIGVRKDFEGNVVIIYGHTRLLAARYINENKLTAEPFLIKGSYYKVNEEEACILTLLENDESTRTAVSPIDMAFFIRELETRFGYSNKDIAEKLGKSPAAISQYKNLLTLETPIQKQIASGKINMQTALTLTTIAPEDRQGVLEGAQADGKRVTAAKVKDHARTKGSKSSKKLTRSLADLKTLMSDNQKHKNRGVRVLTTSILAFLNGDEDAENLINTMVDLGK